MNKVLFIGLLTMVGCAEHQPSTTPLEIVIIDSCEYLYGPFKESTVLVHKGNCKHCELTKIVK